MFGYQHSSEYFHLWINCLFNGFSQIIIAMLNKDDWRDLWINTNVRLADSSSVSANQTPSKLLKVIILLLFVLLETESVFWWITVNEPLWTQSRNIRSCGGLCAVISSYDSQREREIKEALLWERSSNLKHYNVFNCRCHSCKASWWLKCFLLVLLKPPFMNLY